jgi:putative membrane protein
MGIKNHLFAAGDFFVCLEDKISLSMQVEYHHQSNRIPFLVRLIVSTLSVFFAAYLLSGVEVPRFSTAIWIALAIGLLNVFVRPLLILLTLPATLLTFGLFLFVINAVVVLMAASLVKSFEVHSFGWALLFSLLVSIFSGLMFALGGYKNQRSQNTDDNQY